MACDITTQSFVAGNIRSSELEVLTDAEFGEMSGPIFLDQVDCSNQEGRLLDCETSVELGLIQDTCACIGCAETLAIRCPGI